VILLTDELIGDVPDVVLDFIQRGTHTDPDQRATVEELLQHPAMQLLRK
jgi:hypothetical protein